MAQDNRYDVIIVGTGAGGGTLAQRLAPTGKRILLLERGGYLPRAKDNWDSKTVFIDGKYTARETWTDKDGQPFHPGIHYYVGGNTKFYGAALLRFRQEDFGEITHHGGVSPAWPISYQDMAPYYTQAERLYHVHGERGSDPTEPPSDDPYPYPAISHEPRIQKLSDDLARLGHKPFHLPVGVRLDEANPQTSECIRCRNCDGFPCLVNAKADAHITCVQPTLRDYPNVTLITHAKVSKLETDESGRRVTGVVAQLDLPGGATVKETFSAEIVVLSCGAINSAALLLGSASDRHPNGLANSSDTVGRNYMCHNNTAMLTISVEPNPTVFQKTLAINDFYFGSEEWKYPMGHIQMLGKSEADQLRGDAPRFAPGWVLDDMARHSVDFWMTSEDLPDPENRVVVNRDGKISLRYTPNNLEGHRRLVNKLRGMLGSLGMHEHLIPNTLYLGKHIPIAGVAHQNGTIKFGDDPKSSALDTNCKAHDLDNLYVVDGSFFVSSTAVNPALTIIANALRVGDHLAQRLS